MQQKVMFEIDNIQKINLSDYEEDEFGIAKLTFLSTDRNSHDYIFTEEVLRKYSSTALGKWVTADMTKRIDCGTHTDNQIIVGRIPENQEIDFFYDEKGNLRVAVDAVISKIYSKNFCDIFVNDNERSVSMEAIIETENENENLVTSFKILTITVLGHGYNPSVPKSNIVFTRFSDYRADVFYNKMSFSDLTPLQQFTQKRKENLIKQKKWKNFKVDKSKKSLSNKPWGEIDKSALRDKIMKAGNRETLVKSVYMLVEKGWEQAPSQHLKYPVMCFVGDTLVYNKGGLSSALAYAKKEKEISVIKKISKIYKNLNLNEDKEDTIKMTKIKFSAVNIGNIWCKIYDYIHQKDSCNKYCIEGIYEQDNQKFAILKDKEGILYRLDFSLTEEGMNFSERVIEVQQEFIETDRLMKFAEPPNVLKYKSFDDEEDEYEDDEYESDNQDNKIEDSIEDNEEEEISIEKMKKRMFKLQKDIKNKEDIIMEYNNKISNMEKEIRSLREFKANSENEQKEKIVNQLMSEIKFGISSEKFEEFKKMGMKCSFADISGWTNKVKSYCFENGIMPKTKSNDGIFRFSNPVCNEKPISSETWNWK